MSTRPTPSAPVTQLDDLHIEGFDEIISPRTLRDKLPTTDRAAVTVAGAREAVMKILSGNDPRLLVIVGPCSIHDVDAALEYATRLNALRDELGDRLMLMMRVYFEKPRTTVGWKGLINDPHLDGSFDIETGLHRARGLLRDIAEMGLPAGTEFLDPVTPQYLADLVGWAAIGARTTESQTHRQMASGLSMPIGYKNSTEGNLQIALDAMNAADSRHSFLGIDLEGRTVVVRTQGNPWGHLILRGGRGGSNFDPTSIAAAEKMLRDAGLLERLMVDCSHANSMKKYENQPKVWEACVRQAVGGTRAIMGLMLESNLHEGNQKVPDNLADLKYGVSITDACVDWDTTESLLRFAHEQLGHAHV